MKRIFALFNNDLTIKPDRRLVNAHFKIRKHYPFLHCASFERGYIGEFAATVKSAIREKDGVLVILQGSLFSKSKQLSDEDYIIHLYEKYNLSFLPSLNGSYNFLLLDRNSGKLYLVSDKYASRPLYWSYRNGEFVAASEVKIVLDLLKTKPSINWQAWGQYLTYRFTLSNNTFYEGVNLIEPATIATYDLSHKNLHRGVLRIFKYWDYSEIAIDYGRSEKSKINEGATIFKKVFSRLGEQIKNKKTIIPLSGGYDSRGIVSGLLKFSCKRDFDTVTTLHPCGYEGDIVKELVQTLGISNYYIKRPADIYKKYFLDKAFLTDSMVQEHLWMMPLLEKIKNYDVYIDGAAGDIILRSTRVRPMHIEKAKDGLYLAKLFKKQFGFDYGWLKDYMDPHIWKELKYTHAWAKNCFEKIEASENRFLIFLMLYRIRNGVTVGPNNIIGSVVSRVMQPYFSDEIVAFGMSVPHVYKFNGIYRKILDKAFPELTKIKSISDMNPEKLKEYDRRIVQFTKGRRELISDYSPISREDQKFLAKLLRTLKPPPFINKKDFLEDFSKAPKLHRLNTILDLTVWYNLFER